MLCTNPTIKCEPGVGYTKVPDPVDCGEEMERVSGRAYLESNYGGLDLYQCPRCKTIKLD